MHEGNVLMVMKQYAQAVKSYEDALARGVGSAGLIKLHRTLILAGDTTAATRQP